MSEVYNTMYKLTLALVIGQNTVQLSSGDIVSIAIMHRYDTSTYPIIRIRIHADLSVIQDINENPDQIYVRGNLDAGVYRMNTETRSSVMVAPATSMSLEMKGYLENKNIPVSKIDSYKLGISDGKILNATEKIQFELFCYDAKIIHQMRQKAPSIYRECSLETVITDLFRRCNVFKTNIDPIQNQERYDQILIPNLSVIDAFSFFDQYYGLYPNGSMLYGDMDAMYLCSTVAKNTTTTIPIYVRASTAESDEGGMFQTNNGYYMKTGPLNVSVLSETDIERVLNAETISDTNLTTIVTNHEDLTKLFDTVSIDALKDRIEQINILHKSKKTSLSLQRASRLNEQVTHIDLAGAGFDVGLFHPNSRFNLIFETPIRGLNMADAYRPKYICHVFENNGSELFSVSTTMQLCTN